MITVATGRHIMLLGCDKHCNSMFTTIWTADKNKDTKDAS